MYEYTRAFHILLRQSMTFHNANLREVGLHGGYLPHLMVVNAFPGITQEGVADKTGLDKSTVAKMIGKMTAEGYIRRSVDGEDKRAYNLYLTDAGRAMVPRVKASILAYHERITRSLTEVEKLLLAMLLEKMVQSVAPGEYPSFGDEERSVGRACGH